MQVTLKAVYLAEVPVAGYGDDLYRGTGFQLGYNAVLGAGTGAEIGNDATFYTRTGGGSGCLSCTGLSLCLGLRRGGDGGSVGIAAVRVGV